LEECDLLGCIDRGLEPFGSHVKQTIYWKMMILHGSQRQGVIAHPGTFAKVIEEIMGGSAVGIEKSIIREIRKVFDLSVPKTETLVTAIDAARERIVPVSSERVSPQSIAYEVNARNE
jgi:hypothetical protein